MLRLVGEQATGSAQPKLLASHDGFNLHAGTAFDRHERMALERWSRYALRGPLASCRLSLGPNESVVYTLRQPRADGTTQVVFTPESFLRRLCAVLPAPRRHTIVYFGVFASRHSMHREVVQSAPGVQQRLLGCRGRWIDWADLLKRVWAWEVLACACGGTRRVMAAVHEGPIAQKILKHLGLAAELPLLAPARMDPQGELWETGPPDEEYRQVPAPDEFDQRLAESELE